MRKYVATVVLILCFSASKSETSRWQYFGPDTAHFDTYIYPTFPVLIPDRIKTAVVYAKTGGLVHAETKSPERLYYSHNGGRRWSRALTEVRQALVHPATSDVYALIYSGNKRVLVKSTDQGRSFSTISSSLELFRLFLHPTDPNTLFGIVSSADDLAISTDGGRFWATIQNLPKQGRVRYDFQDLLISPFDPKKIYLSAHYYDEYENRKDLLLLSQDLGRSWMVLEKKLYRFHFDPAFPQRAFAFSYDEIKILTPSGWRHRSEIDFRLNLLVSIPRNPKRLLALVRKDYGEQKILLSTDEGKRWKEIPVDMRDRIVTLASLDDSAGTLLGGTDGAGIFRRDFQDPRWRGSSTGLHESNVQAVAASEDNIYALNNGIYFYSKKGTQVWSRKVFRHRLPIFVSRP